MSVDHVLRGTAFVLLTWNQLEQTRRCLQSFVEAGYPLSRVVLWDNGSTDGTDEAIISEFPDVTYHHHPTNQGVASGRNRAALLAVQKLSASHLLFLDNDMVVTPGFLESLCEPFTTEPGQAQAMAKIRFFDEPERLHSAGGQVVNFALGIKTGIGYREIDRGQHNVRKSCLPSGGATLVAASVFLELDGFDSVFDPFGTEDLDFALRVREAGYLGTYIPEAVVYHDYQRKTASGNGGDSYIAARVRHWMILLHRHATLPQQLGFYLGGAIVGFVKVAIRQVLSGNASALKGIPKGVGDYASDLPQPESIRPASPRAGLETD
jgi:GT2 family glycosyltransferase